jgi:hypothetical protein
MFLKLMLTNGAEREGTEMNQILIDPEFRSLIPPLTKEELEQLEQNLIKDGCRDALIVWNDILLDGHNRYEICSEHNITYRTEEKHFRNRDEAKEWIIRNQFGRRNLSAFDRSKLALRLKELIQAKAKEKQRDAGGDHGNQYTGGKVPLMQKSAEAAEIFETRDSVSQKSTETNQGKEIDLLPSAEANPIVTREEIAKLAGVSHDTIDKVKVIEKEATPEQKAKLSTGETKINTVFTDIQANKAVEKYPELKELPKKEAIQTAKKLDVILKPERPKVISLIKESKESELKQAELTEEQQQQKARAERFKTNLDRLIKRLVMFANQPASYYFQGLNEIEWAFDRTPVFAENKLEMITAAIEWLNDFKKEYQIQMVYENQRLRRVK